MNKYVEFERNGKETALAYSNFELQYRAGMNEENTYDIMSCSVMIFVVF
jgi:hypothetical protein